MGQKGAVALATLLPTILFGGCGDVQTWPRMCLIFAECDGFPSERAAETAKPRLPDGETFDSGPSKKEIERYRSDECGEKCARKQAEKAERSERARRAARDYDERMNRDWLPADDARRWR